MTDSRGCEHEGTKVETASNRLNGVADPEGATVPFNPTLNYDRSSDGVFADINVQYQYRNLQIATQFHRYCFTCFKYCYSHNQVCRFEFPWVTDSCSFEPIIRRDRDKKSRRRVSVVLKEIMLI